MGIQYKAIDCKRIIFGLLLTIFVASYSNKLLAQSSLFTVENITVDVTAKSAVAAQEQAFEKAQRLAFIVLAKRLVTEGQANNVRTPDSLTLSTLIKDYEVTNEKLSAIRYVGTYTFRFNEPAISKLFSLSGVSYTQNTSKTLLVLPVLKRNGQTTIWSEDNKWLQAWSRVPVSSRLVPIEIPIGDLADMSDIDDNDALRYQRSKLDRMLRRYNATEAAIMIAEPEANEKKLRISIYRTDRGRAEYVQDLRIDAQDGESTKVLLERGVIMANDALQKDWKRKNAFNESQRKSYFLRMPLKNLKQWVNAKSALTRLPGASDLNILSIRPKEAKISLNFRGDESRFRQSLSRAMINLGEKDQDGIYEIYMGRRKVNSFLRPANEKPESFSSRKQTF